MSLFVDKKKRKRTGPPVIVSTTIERRSLIQWFGKATVLALGADLAAACSTFTGMAGDAGSGTDDTDSRTDPDTDTDMDASVPDVCDGPDDFDFAPGPLIHQVYEDWGERTVDPQDLMDILAQWSLRVDGLVANPVTLDFNQLLQLNRRDQVTDFHCVEGWSIHGIPWNGVSFQTLVNLVQPAAEATHITFHSLGGVYIDSLPLDVALEPNSLLAYGIDCSTLPLKHGFPLRVVVPRKWGYKGPKFVYRMEFKDSAETGFWEQYGYPYDGDVPEGRLRDGFY